LNYRQAARLVLRLPYLFQAMPNSDRLQIGCGSNLLPGWINTDMIPGKGVNHLDVNRPLPFPSGRLRYVFSEHLIEHIPYESGINLLREIYRVLACNVTVRIATPGFAFLVRLYQHPDNEYIKWAAEWSSIPPTALQTINNFVRNWGHQFVCGISPP
jgi:predicted SAM-dependent methyltransferase